MGYLIKIPIFQHLLKKDTLKAKRLKDVKSTCHFVSYSMNFCILKPQWPVTAKESSDFSGWLTNCSLQLVFSA